MFRASRYLFEYEAREPVAVKGIEKPVMVYRPLEVKEKPDPKRGIRGLTSPMVGRDGELGQLKARVETALGGRCGALFLLGEAGLGKSRLLEELRQWIGQQKLPVFVLESRCPTYGETILYGPFLQVLGTIFGIADQAPPEQVRERILEKGRALFPEAWKDVVPYLGYLFSTRFEGELDEKVKYLDPKDLKTQILVSVRRLLAALFRTQPLLLVLEDYHWIDTASLELLEFLFDAPEPFPMLLLALSRVEKEKEGYKVKERLKARLGGDFLEIVLEPLSPNAGTQLVYNLLKMPGFTEGLKDRILSKAEGNPFYLEEIVRSLIDAQVLAFMSGVWQLASPVESFSIPDTVNAVIASRLDKLEKDVREVLQMASVIGRNFHVPILERLSGIEDLMLTLYLADIEEHEYVREFKRDPDLEYIFRHPLFQEVAYHGLLRKRRRELHRRAGEAIEELYRNRLEDFTELWPTSTLRGTIPGRPWSGSRRRAGKPRTATPTTRPSPASSRWSSSSTAKGPAGSGSWARPTRSSGTSTI